MIKPGSYAPASSHAISRLVQKYLDGECIKVAEGGRKVTGQLLEERYDKICFTGSGFVGKIVLEAAAKHLTPCILELGGKSPCIVDQSAHLGHAAKRLVWASFINGGQTCVRPDFLMVHEKVADEFFSLVKAAIRDFYGSDPQQTEWFGRCINASAFHRLEALVKGAASDGKVCFGGRVDASDKYIEPTLLDYGSDLDAFKQCGAMADEIFGPVMPAVRFSSVEQVVTFTKELRTGKPLALYCYARDARFVDKIKRRTTSGGLCINDSIMHLVNHELPFGGVGASGMGSYHGKRSFLAFTHEKAVLEKSPSFDETFVLRPLLAARFPPYTPFKQALVRLFSMRLADHAVNVHRTWAFWWLLGALACYAMGIRIAITWA